MNMIVMYFCAPLIVLWYFVRVCDTSDGLGFVRIVNAALLFFFASQASQLIFFVFSEV